MRVALFSSVIDGQDSGIGNYTLGLLRTFIEKGHSDEIVLIHSQNSNNEIYAQFEEHIIGYTSICKHKIYFSANELKEVLLTSGCSLIHFPCFVKGQFGLYNIEVPIIVTLHDVIQLLRSYAALKDSVTWGSALFFVKQKVSHWITDSEYSKRDIVKYIHMPAESVSVVYPAADPIYHPIENKEHLLMWARERYNINGRFLLYVGALDYRKNVPTLVSAFNMIKRMGFPHKLVIIGRRVGKYKDTVKAIQESPFSEDIIGIEYVEKRDLLNLYNLADLFVFPSFYEGFGLPPLEAMACGTPTVTSNVTSLPEVVGDAAVTFDPHNVDELAAIIEKVLTDKELRQELSLRGLERVKQFSWDRSAKQTWEIYERFSGKGVYVSDRGTQDFSRRSYIC